MDHKAAITIAELHLHPFTTFDPEGIVLVSGTEVAKANPMTISWGMFGMMWGRPVAMAMVRRSRYTWEFLREARDFTLNWMPKDWSDAVQLCGRESGRNVDKFAATGMTPISGTVVQSPQIAESALSLECRVIYQSAVLPEQFVDRSVLKIYTDTDYHDLFFGDIVAATGVEHFRIK
jgi:flavin reductase (DIM6/NTAB) family NADH-FMN oxidoreductase RutF